MNVLLRDQPADAWSMTVRFHTTTFPRRKSSLATREAHVSYRKRPYYTRVSCRDWLATRLPIPSHGSVNIGTSVLRYIGILLNRMAGWNCVERILFLYDYKKIEN